MFNFLRPIAASLILLAISSSVSAQTVTAALASARARVACGTDVLVSATYLPTGQIQVTCARNAPNNQLPEALEGTTLSTTAAAGIVTVAVFVGVIVGNDDAVATTTDDSFAER